MCSSFCRGRVSSQENQRRQAFEVCHIRQAGKRREKAGINSESESPFITAPRRMRLFLFCFFDRSDGEPLLSIFLCDCAFDFDYFRDIRNQFLVFVRGVIASD
jgi:hypothetical protein